MNQYIPRHYQQTESDLITKVIHDSNFATFITQSPQEPFISHLPFIYLPSTHQLVCHCAKANPHWKMMRDDPRTTVIIQGPHAYISPAWYSPDPDNVPTWNYVTVHIQGASKIVEDFNQSWLRMKEMVHYFENKYQTGWSLPDNPNSTLQQDIAHGIVVFEIQIEKIDAKFKLSQKQDPENRNSVIKNLPLVHGEQGQKVSDYMKWVLE